MGDPLAAGSATPLSEEHAEEPRRGDTGADPDRGEQILAREGRIRPRSPAKNCAGTSTGASRERGKEEKEARRRRWRRLALECF